MKTYRSLFHTILTAGEEESRKAAREVRRVLYSAREGRNEYKDIAKIIDTTPSVYYKIPENDEWRQENFVMAVSVLYFLHDREHRPEFLFVWLSELLWHPNGNIRHAAVRMFNHEVGPLTVHIRCPKEEFRVNGKKSDEIISDLYVMLVSIINKTWEPSYKKKKYISDLPSGTHKSAHLILAYLSESCGKEYMKRLRKKYW